MPVSFRGGQTCSCVAISLPWVEFDMKRRGLIQNSIDIYQLGYRTDVSASAGTHAAGGCTDVGQYHSNQITVWRWWGWTEQRRDIPGVVTHAHGWPYKCPHLSSAAQSQARDWDNKDAGLVGGAQVQGPWPVLPWKDAFRRNVVSLLSDVVDDIVDGVAKKLLANLPAEVWKEDIIPNWVNDGNEKLVAFNAINRIGDDARAIRTKLQA